MPRTAGRRRRSWGRIVEETDAPHEAGLRSSFGQVIDDLNLIEVEVADPDRLTLAVDTLDDELRRADHVDDAAEVTDGGLPDDAWRAVHDPLDGSSRRDSNDIKLAGRSHRISVPQSA